MVDCSILNQNLSWLVDNVITYQNSLFSCGMAWEWKAFLSHHAKMHLHSHGIFNTRYTRNRYNREEVVASLGREINLNPPLHLGQLPDTSEELLKLDQVNHY